MTFGDWLLEQLKKEEMSQADLARRSGLTRGAVSMLVRGQTQPKGETCGRIAQALGLTPETVLKAAGILPELPNPEQTPYPRQVLDLMRRMDPDEQRDIFDYVLWYYRKKFE